ncbi:hypothetical protein Tco_0868642 [Tanacetum coccineum]
MKPHTPHDLNVCFKEPWRKIRKGGGLGWRTIMKIVNGLVASFIMERTSKKRHQSRDDVLYGIRALGETNSDMKMISGLRRILLSWADLFITNEPARFQLNDGLDMMNQAIEGFNYYQWAHCESQGTGRLGGESLGRLGGEDMGRLGGQGMELLGGGSIGRSEGESISRLRREAKHTWHGQFGF